MKHATVEQSTYLYESSAVKAHIARRSGAEQIDQRQQKVTSNRLELEVWQPAFQHHKVRQ